MLKNLAKYNMKCNYNKCLEDNEDKELRKKLRAGAKKWLES